MSSPKSRVIVTAIVLGCLSVALVLTWQGTRRRQATPQAPGSGSAAVTKASSDTGASAGSVLDVVGFWEGLLQVQGGNYRLVLKVSGGTNGTYIAALDSVDQGAKDIPINQFTVSNRQVRAELLSLGASYEAQVNGRSTEMSGTWRQGPLSLPLTLVKTATPSSVAAPLPATAYARRAEAPLQGVWAGTMKARDVPLRLAFKITATAPGQYGATLDSVDQGAKGIPVALVEFNAPEVRLAVEAINGQYEGTLSADGSAIDGTWSQGGGNLSLQLKRTEPGEDAPLAESAYAFTRETELQGIWNGTLDIRGTKLRLLFKIGRVAADSYRATLDSPDQGAKDIPATSVTFRGNDVELEWKAMRALFHGQLENGKLIGFWQQGPAEFPLELTRTNRSAAAVPAPTGK